MATDFGSVPKGMHLYPTFTVDGAATIALNFDGQQTPFEASNAIAGLRTERDLTNYIGALPKEILQKILAEAASTASAAALTWPRVSQQWNEISSCNDIWLKVYLNSWPNQNPRLKVKSWKKFFVRRFVRNRFWTFKLLVIASDSVLCSFVSLVVFV